MTPEIRDALDRLSYEVQTETGIKDLLLVQAEIMQLEKWLTEFRAETRVFRSQISEQDEAIRTLMLEVEHLRELLPV